MEDSSSRTLVPNLLHTSPAYAIEHLLWSLTCKALINVFFGVMMRDRYMQSGS